MQIILNADREYKRKNSRKNLKKMISTVGSYSITLQTLRWWLIHQAGWWCPFSRSVWPLFAFELLRRKIFSHLTLNLLSHAIQLNLCRVSWEILAHIVQVCSCYLHEDVIMETWGSYYALTLFIKSRLFISDWASEQWCYKFRVKSFSTAAAFHKVSNSAESHPTVVNPKGMKL